MKQKWSKTRKKHPDAGRGWWIKDVIGGRIVLMRNEKEMMESVMESNRAWLEQVCVKSNGKKRGERGVSGGNAEENGGVR